MALKNQNPTETIAWKSLQELYQGIKNTDMKKLFMQDSERLEKYSLKHDDLSLNFSKNRINDDVLKSLVALANEVDLQDGIDKMFAGDIINETENRAVLHTALRNKSGNAVMFEGENVMDEVNDTLQKMKVIQ